MEHSPVIIKMLASCDEENRSGASAACLNKGILIEINKMSGMLSGEDFARSNSHNFRR